ncbi:MAG: regulatory protein RecX [Sediminibacterium sp.]|nr:regulatory protein RecX [Sediminibacterium sp.]MDP3128864.1 regulatory protein RecX [Sediminibacterium sp.]MDP3666163.1 regulatory protein RecX [Sediminibacterium sp.]
MRDKLYGLGLSKKEVEPMVARLIEEGYLNEERFAILFAGGHFRQKKWGKVKIEYVLRQKKVSEANIKKALKELQGADYAVSLQKLAMARWKSLKGEQYLARRAKTIAYLARKGYEMGLILDMIKKIKSEVADYPVPPVR